MFEIMSNNTLSRAELDTTGTIKNIHYGDVLIKFGDTLNIQNDDIPYIKDNSKIRNPKYLANGDVIIADTAEDETVGKSTEIYGITDEKVVSGLHTIPVRPLQKFASKYLGYYINSPAYHNQLLAIMQGIKVYSISKSNIANTIIKFPNIQTQSKIAELLFVLDRRIEKQHRLIDSIKSYKRGLKSRLFDKTSNDWNTVKLSEILCERKTYCEKDGTYPHATLSKDGVSAKTERYDRDYLVASDDKKYKITHYGDICYNPANLKFGVICLNTFGSAIFSPIYITFEVNPNYDIAFIGECLTRADFINKALQYQQGTVYERMAVSPEDLLSMEIKTPSLAKQKQIAKCLKSFDTFIAKHEAILSNLLSLKTTLLQQLFI